MIEERIERDVEAVVLADVVVLPQILRGDVGRIVVVELGADVEIVVVVEQINFRLFVRLRVFDRRRLMQIVDERGRGPHRLVEFAVDDGTHARAHHAHRFLARIARRRGWLGEGSYRGKQPEQRPSARRTHRHDMREGTKLDIAAYYEAHNQRKLAWPPQSYA